MSDKPELMYFDGPGRANLTRLAFVAGGIEFTDTRISNWPEVKADPASVPAKLFGSMPCIKDGELLLAQSVVTACYAAELGIWKGMDGKQKAVDMMVATTNEDLRAVMYKCLFGDDAAKAKGKEDLPEAAAKFLVPLEKMLERKTTGGAFFVSTSGPSLADLAVFDNVYSPFPGLKALGVDLAAYPKLVACADAVAADSKVKAFADKGFKL
jgi:hypothetical protein